MLDRVLAAADAWLRAVDARDLPWTIGQQDLWHWYRVKPSRPVEYLRGGTLCGTGHGDERSVELRVTSAYQVRWCPWPRSRVLYRHRVGVPAHDLPAAAYLAAVARDVARAEAMAGRGRAARLRAWTARLCGTVAVARPAATAREHVRRRPRLSRVRVWRGVIDYPDD